MKSGCFSCAIQILLACTAVASEHYVSPTGGNVPPFSTWGTAANNIQDAIEAASVGDTVWVTNGTYSTGLVLAGGATNRIALNKPLTVSSVNGPFVTTILGALDPHTGGLGPLAVRCAWVTNGAVLVGFALQNGATPGGQNGGGVSCARSGIVANCIIQRNMAFCGGGAYSGTLCNCAVLENTAAQAQGGGAFSAHLVNCTVVGNVGGGAVMASVTNCIIIQNFSGTLPGAILNCSGTYATYSCTTPLVAGAGNITNAPQLLPDQIHLASFSPCVAAGMNVTLGADIDGKPWANPPSMGCAQWQPAPSVGKPAVTAPAGLEGLNITAIVAGQPPFTCWWSKDGLPVQEDGHFNITTATNLQILNPGPADDGFYELVASNSFGMATSAVLQVVIHCVSSSGNGTPPYLDWARAATNIQDAIDVAAWGEVVLVTNGVYATGGKVMAGDLTNRVALDKPLAVQSLHGALATVIRGAWDPVSTNGPAAVRCAWIGNGAVLNGFTLSGGGTRNIHDSLTLQSGGGAWGSSTAATVANCIIRDCSASVMGGGGCQVSIWGSSVLGNSTAVRYGDGGGGGLYGCRGWNCVISANATASSGGGAFYCDLRNCLIRSNAAAVSGGGACATKLVNCTVIENTARVGGVGRSGGGVSGTSVSMSFATNCIIYGNQCAFPAYPSETNYDDMTLIHYCCTAPLPGWGVGNICADPQFILDGFHLSATSPCIAAGFAAVTSESDLDGQRWANAPSIGCDEFYATDFTGPISLISAAVVAPDGLTPVLAWSCPTAKVAAIGKISQTAWSFGDGTVLTNCFTLAPLHTWTNSGHYALTFTAFNYDNPNGVSTNFGVTISQPPWPPLHGPRLDGTNLSFTYASRVGASYIVQRTTSLTLPIDWTPVATVIALTTNATFTDPSATNPLSFYRLQPR